MAEKSLNLISFWLVNGWEVIGDFSWNFLEQTIGPLNKKPGHFVRE